MTGELIDATTGVHIWADRFDGTLADIFDLQDQVTASVVATIEPRLLFAEVDQVRRNPPNDMQAYDLFLRATGHFYATTKEDIEAALALVTRSIQLDPSYARSYALAGRCYFHRKVRGWVPRTDPTIAEGVRLARIAVDKGGDNPEVLWMAAIAIGLAGGDLEGGVALIDRALMLNPNSADALAYSGMLRAYLGKSIARWSIWCDPTGSARWMSNLQQIYRRGLRAFHGRALRGGTGRVRPGVGAQARLPATFAYARGMSRPARPDAGGSEGVGPAARRQPARDTGQRAGLLPGGLQEAGACERLVEGLRRCGLPAGE